MSTPCGPLWPEGENLALRGLYRTSGEQQYIDIYQLLPDAPPCWSRFFLDRDLGLGSVSWQDPYYIELTGWLSTGRWSSPALWDLQVKKWSQLPLDPPAIREACRQAVFAQSAALQDLDWAALATPTYVTSTANFRPSLEELAHFEVQILGADAGRPLLVLMAAGPEFPQVRPLVRRWIAVECVYDWEQERVIELVATIQGEVQE